MKVASAAVSLPSPQSSAGVVLVSWSWSPTFQIPDRLHFHSEHSHSHSCPQSHTCSMHFGWYETLHRRQTPYIWRRAPWWWKWGCNSECSGMNIIISCQLLISNSPCSLLCSTMASWWHVKHPITSRVWWTEHNNEQQVKYLLRHRVRCYAKNTEVYCKCATHTVTKLLKAA